MGRVWPRHEQRARPLNAIVSRHMMRCAIVLTVVLLATGCESGAECSDMAFARAGGATRIAVKSNDGSVAPVQIDDPAQIKRIVQFVTSRGTNWYAPWYGVPVGQISVEMFQGDKFVADFAAGKDFFQGQGCGFFYIRKASPSEVSEFLKLLGVSYQMK